MKKLKRYQYERYAVLCSLAYQPVFRQTQYGFAPKGQRVVLNSQGRVMMRVLWQDNSDEVIVVIKGSHSLRDWLSNLMIWKTRPTSLGLNYSIHAGYNYLIHQESQPKHKIDHLGDSVFAKLDSILTPLIVKGKRVSFTGHSSGGAIGCVLADYYEKRYPTVIKRVVTFGQPAISGLSFKRQYSLKYKTYRICCDLDIVSFLPPIPVYYTHVGRELWLYNGRIYENTPTFIRLVRSFTSWIMRPFTYHLRLCCLNRWN